MTHKEALKEYDNKQYRTPDGYTSDIVIFTIRKEEEAEFQRSLHILLIKRALINSEGQPNIEGGKWALPGGFVAPDETAFEAAARELKEETGLCGIHLKHYAVYDQEGRDPRGWIISNAHYAAVPEHLLTGRKAGDDAMDVRLVNIHEALERPLAFDHETIIKDALRKIQLEMLQTTLAKEFLPQEFTLSELRHIVLCVAGDLVEEVVKSEPFFWRKAPKLPFIEKVLNEDGSQKTTQRHSKFKTKLYRFNEYSPIKSIYK
ncbi:NUDIX domain-containing protein [Bacillus aerolatus]|uniref:NUDIX domain-containing protein n=1 Tax=Bacillus aerolatus TaxID=2653354 RepID=A0A6I1FYT2_9BACI|nr:NUDIX domain-containing protein [Bacillus aerolatus]